jgi:hypothetical protein
MEGKMKDRAAAITFIIGGLFWIGTVIWFLVVTFGVEL